MKRLLLIGGLLAAFSCPAAWNLYSGSAIVKPRVDYASQDDCSAAAQKQPAGKYTCRSLAVVPITVAPMTHGGLAVDLAGWPVPKPGVSQVMLTPPGDIPPLPTDPLVDGAFRLLCNWSRMSFDDPIVYPGQPGMAHHHTFFGNTAIDAFTTPDNIRSKGNASCRGGTVNLSGYWVPSVIDTKTHKPVAPLSLLVYYKTGFWSYMPDGSVIQPLPPGLRMITGNPKGTTPDGIAAFQCFMPDTGTTRDGTYGTAIPTACQPSDTMRVMIQFRQCWDGKNLDSPDHQSHMANTEAHWAGDPERQYRCPPTHPVVLPLITFIVDYPVSGDISGWRLASDMYTGPGGYSMHADWMNGWDPAISNVWGVECMQKRRNCGSFNLGDGRGAIEFDGN